MIPFDAELLRLYVKSSDRLDGRPLYRAIVKRARELHLAGASVFPVALAFGRGGRWQDADSEYLSSELPLVIEFIDVSSRIDALLAELDSMRATCLMTRSAVRVLRLAPERPASSPSDLKG